MVVLGPVDAAADAALLDEIALVPDWRLVDVAIGAPGVETELLIDDGGL